MTKNTSPENINLTDTIKKLRAISEWFESQEEIDVEKGLDKVKEGAILITKGRARLRELQNEFEEIKKSWMKVSRARGALFLSLIIALWCAPSFAFAEEHRINTFVAHIILHSDGSADVQEEIVYNFGSTTQHGIYREIPLVQSSGNSVRPQPAEISSISVTDGLGNPRQTTYDKGGNMVTLKIGDAQAFVTGAQLYVIRYRLWGAFTPSLLSDRFDWNATGYEWKVPIDRARVDVVLPKPLSEDAFSFSCTAGGVEGGVPCASSIVQEYATSGLAHMLRFSQDGLAKRQGIALQIDFRKGSILYGQEERNTSPTTAQPAGRVVKWWTQPFIDLSLSFPFFVFAGLYTIYLAEKNGVSKKKSGTKKDELWSFSTRQTYLFAGVIIAGLSVFLPAWNLGVFTSGVVIFLFAFAYPRRK